MGTETPAASLAATFVGHSTVLIEMDGVRVLTDPLLRLRVGALIRHSPLPPVSVYRDLEPGETTRMGAAQQSMLEP